MVRKLKVVEVYTPEEITQADDAEQEQPIEQEQEQPIEQEPDNEVLEASADTEVGAAAAAAVEEQSPKPIDVPTNSKILEQVSCPACGKFMSAKNLRYAHQKYCTARATEEQPPEITVPEVEVEEPPPEKTIKKVPVKRAKAKAKPQDTEKEQPTLENGGILPADPGMEAPYRGQMDIVETPEEFWRRTMRDLKDKKKRQYQNLCSNAF